MDKKTRNLLLKSSIMQRRAGPQYEKALREKELEDNRKRVLQTIKNRQRKADEREAEKRAEQRARAERVRRQMAARAREAAGKDSDKPENKYQDEIDKILDKDKGVPDVKAPGEPDTTPDPNQKYLDAIDALTQQIADFTTNQPDYETQLATLKTDQDKAIADQKAYYDQLMGTQKEAFEAEQEKYRLNQQKQNEAYQAQVAQMQESQYQYQTQLAQQQAAALRQRELESQTATANLARSGVTPDFRIGAQRSTQGQGGTMGFKRSGYRAPLPVTNIVQGIGGFNYPLQATI